MSKGEALFSDVAVLPAMNFPARIFTPDLSRGLETAQLHKHVSPEKWGVGGYLEKRSGMYTAPQFKNRRNIHIGIDVWCPAGESVMVPLPGILLYKTWHPEPGNYGGTLVAKLRAGRQVYYALFGHLSKQTVILAETGKNLAPGDKIGEIGTLEENGNWPPHLHFQISLEDPGKADMPGVVARKDLPEAKKKYIDPAYFLGMSRSSGAGHAN